MITPSSIPLDFPPLLGVLGRSEREALAAILVRYCFHCAGDRFAPVQPRELGEFLNRVREGNIDDYWVRAIITNPFLVGCLNPDPLIAEGFARWTTPELKRQSSIELTDKFFEALGARAVVRALLGLARVA